VVLFLSSAQPGAALKMVEAVSAEAARAQLRDFGFVIVPDVVAATECNQLVCRLDRPAEGRAGSRALLKESWCRELADTIRRHSKIASLLPPAAVAVQCTLFEKSPANNWLVAFHQDQSIPVAARIASEHCGGWADKDGLTFVQPPSEVLAQMLAVRLQIDHPDGSDGALRVIPGSHGKGKLTGTEISGFRSTAPEVSCKVEQGDVLVMRPLLLHASSKVAGLRPRRVLHFLFGPAALPHGLRWPAQ
jgi:ectoine hydroxylase-related dioxygenase (phytanoyl-CoA dioxygenase family)